MNRLTRSLTVLFLALCAASARAGTTLASGTWTAAGGPYYYPGNDIEVDTGTTLTIQAGTLIKLDAGKSFKVLGTLVVNGTSASHVTFTSSTQDASTVWSALRFYAGSSGTLTYATVAYAGTGGVAAIQAGQGDADANTGAVSVTASHCTVSNVNGYGVSVSTNFSGATNFTLKNSTVQGAARGGVNVINALPTDSVQILSNDFTGNTAPIIVQASADGLAAFNAGAASFNGNLPSDTFSLPTFSTFDQNVTLWHNLNVEAGADGGPTINAGATLTVKPGVTVAFGDSQALDVYGALAVAGSAASPATFTSTAATPAAGAWDGIWVHAGGTATMDQFVAAYGGESGNAVIFVDGGSAALTHGEVHDGAASGVGFRDTGSATQTLSVQTCSIHNDATGVGIGLAIPGDAATVSGNTFASNGVNLAVPASSLTVFNAGVAAVSGNTPDDTITIGGGSLAAGTVFWGHGLAATSLNVPAGATTTLRENSSLAFGPSAALTVDGTLNAPGLPAQPARLDASNAVKGGWIGVQYRTGSKGALDTTILQHAGAGGSAGLSVAGANVTVTRSALLNGAGPGLVLSGADTVSVTRTVISGNDGAGIVDTATGTRTIGNAVGSGDDIYGNGGAANTGATAAVDFLEADDNYWGAASGPYHPTLNPDGAGQTVSDHIHFQPFSSSALNGPVAIISPINSAAKGTVIISGTASASLLDHWVLEYGAGDAPTSWTTIVSGTANVTSGQLAAWNTAGLNSHQRYSVRLTVYDLLGRSAQSQVVTQSPKGDIDGNGFVDLADGVHAVRIASGVDTVLPGQLKFGDVRPAPSGDGVITSADAAAILKLVGGLTATLP